MRGHVSSQAAPSAFADIKSLPHQPHQLIQIAKQIFEENTSIYQKVEDQMSKYF